MNQTARIISIYAADTSGFCSALYEYGGMTVIHDASGCNSTYTTHDEPRWYDMDSMMYISGLTESDAVMGNDDKFIFDLCQTAEELKPSFIAICASALPAMIGIDMEAIAYEVESRTGIPAFEVKTNAMQSYITGAGNAFVELAKKFTKPIPKRQFSSFKDAAEGEIMISIPESKHKVNVLGLTPLDFPLKGSSEAIQNWLEESGYAVNALVGMHHIKSPDPLDEIVHLTDADVNLVVSSIGMPLARFLADEYGIPYVIGTPYGNEFSHAINASIQLAAVTGKNINIAKDYSRCGSKVTIIGESITSVSLAAAIYNDLGIPVRVLESVGDGEMSVLTKAAESLAKVDKELWDIYGPALDNISCDEEDELERELEYSDVIIADPLFEPICKGKHFVRLPHAAFSGRCYSKEDELLINRTLKETRLGNEIVNLPRLKSRASKRKISI